MTRIHENIEAEEAILGGILLDPYAIDKVVDILIPEAFYISAHQIIYRAALTLNQQGLGTDLITLTTWLKNHKQLERVGGKNKLAQLLESTVSAVNIDVMAELIIEKYQRRQLLAIALEIAQLGEETATGLPQILGAVEARIFSLTQSKGDKFQPQSIGEYLPAAFINLKQGVTPGLTTGLIDLDSLMGGLQRKDLIVVAGRASMGKTWVGCYLANQVALQGSPVVFFSAEMSKEQLVKRFLAMHSGIDSQRLIQNKVYKSEWDALSSAIGALSELPIIIDDSPASSQNPTRMRSVLRRTQKERGQLGLIILDYIQKLGDRAASNRAQTVGAIAGACKDIAKEFNVPLIALAQINRGVETQANKRPCIADIKDSGDIEQDMDIGLLIYRDEYYNPDSLSKGLMEINVAKNRNGRVGVCEVWFSPENGNFRSVDREKTAPSWLRC
ncbi:replicative DNA helicase [Calothrix sp. PCC 7716]|nr:replicative DNA helicase [Calothrix sp. PCC 7716]BDA73668.1 replicative DNA helicase [Calothrix sp. PCC 7716]